MKILYHTQYDDIATVFVGKDSTGQCVEFVESTQPPYTRHEKWVLIISVLYGCPVNCPFCDANGFYNGKISESALWEQLDYLIDRRFANRHVDVSKFKIQFARMGDPAFNMNVIHVLNQLQQRYDAPGLMPSISTIAPLNCDEFFKELLKTKKKYYSQGNFQLQFSIHTTDLKMRDQLIPVKKWTFENIARYGDAFFKLNDRKMTLNFALTDSAPIDVHVLQSYFDKDKFLIKLTPINPTFNAHKNNIKSFIDPFNHGRNDALVKALEDAEYDVLLSIGELKENEIGSNCGQYIQQLNDM
jgi:23S rRNA (adenine2503-C2)-methyltransferase